MENMIIKDNIVLAVRHAPCEICPQVDSCKTECSHFKLFVETNSPEKRKQLLNDFAQKILTPA